MTIAIQRTAASRASAHANAEQIAFSSVFSDHMLVARFRDGGWQEAVIREYGTLALPPNISALQYGLSVFEGLKAHRTVDGNVALFRLQPMPRDSIARRRGSRCQRFRSSYSCTGCANS